MQEIFCGKTVEAKNIDTDLLQNLNKELLNFQKYLKPENNDFFSKQYNNDFLKLSQALNDVIDARNKAINYVNITNKEFNLIKNFGNYSITIILDPITEALINKTLNIIDVLQNNTF